MLHENMMKITLNFYNGEKKIKTKKHSQQKKTAIE